MMLKKNQNRKHYGTIRTLLLNCVKLLDEEKHSQVYTLCVSVPLLVVQLVFDKPVVQHVSFLTV